MKTARLCAYNFKDENKKEAMYWRDVGTIDAVLGIQHGSCECGPAFELTIGVAHSHYQTQNPPAKFVFAQEKKGGRLGIASIRCAPWMHYQRRPGADSVLSRQRSHQ